MFISPVKSSNKRMGWRVLSQLLDIFPMHTLEYLHFIF